MTGDELLPMTATLISTPMICISVYLASHADRKIKQQAALWGMGGSMIQAIASWYLDSFWKYVNTALVAAFLAMWWYWGGGDGLKRRWKSFVAGFGPRMMPKGAS